MKKISGRSDPLTTADRQVREFAKMLTQWQGGGLGVAARCRDHRCARTPVLRRRAALTTSTRSLLGSPPARRPARRKAATVPRPVRTCLAHA